MSTRNPGLIKNYKASGTIGKYLIVKPGASTGLVAVASAATDKIIGVLSEVDAADGERADVIRSGIAPVIYGETIAAGDLLTSDANGKAVTTSTGNTRILGIAEVAGVADDIGSVMICPGVF
jgi:hypothetical protein